LIELFRIVEDIFPSCNTACCALQHDFLQAKKIFRIVKRWAGEKKPTRGVGFLVLPNLESGLLERLEWRIASA
jgi:hypothetical protein